MAAKTDNQLKLSDGHAIGYAEYGNLAGRPVLYLHGLPSSRLEMNNPDTIEVAERLHVRAARTFMCVTGEAGLNSRRSYFETT